MGLVPNDFTVDHADARVTCPAGLTRSITAAKRKAATAKKKLLCRTYRWSNFAEAPAKNRTAASKTVLLRYCAAILPVRFVSASFRPASALASRASWTKRRYPCWCSRAAISSIFIRSPSESSRTGCRARRTILPRPLCGGRARARTL